jgi:hypothetical protein
MLRKLGREDFVSSNPFLEKKVDRYGPFLWRVYEDYEVVDEEGGLPYLRASKRAGSGTPEVVKLYRPLIDTPRIFLDFARIAERKNPRQALSQWISQYGLLGLADEGPQWFAEGAPEVVVPPRVYNDRGGRGETLDAVWYEVYTTNHMLALYESVLNRDTNKLELLLYPPQDGPERLQQSRQHAKELMHKTDATWIDVLIDQALRQVWEYVMELAVFAYPGIGTVGDLHQQPLLTVDRLTASWEVRNLLGAMYLQFYWLISSAGELSHCKHCGGIISYAPPTPTTGVRKPRKDKEFCSTQCRQNYHYHNRIKLRRQTERR